MPTAQELPFQSGVKAGSPIRAGVNTDKKAFVPNFFFVGLTHCQEVRSARTTRTCHFSLLIPDADRRAIACAEAIRSVTHLVLAPDRKSLFIKSFPVFFFVFLAIDLVRPSRFNGTRKRSVPVRVHSDR